MLNSIYGSLFQKASGYASDGEVPASPTPAPAQQQERPRSPPERAASCDSHFSRNVLKARSQVNAKRQQKLNSFRSLQNTCQLATASNEGTEDELSSFEDARTELTKRLYEKRDLVAKLQLLDSQIGRSRTGLIQAAQTVKQSIAQSENCTKSAFRDHGLYANADQNFSQAVKEYNTMTGQDLDDFETAEEFQADLKRVQGQLKDFDRIETVSSEQVDNDLKEVLDLMNTLELGYKESPVPLLAHDESENTPPPGQNAARKPPPPQQATARTHPSQQTTSARMPGSTPRSEGSGPAELTALQNHSPATGLSPDYSLKGERFVRTPPIGKTTLDLLTPAPTQESPGSLDYSPSDNGTPNTNPCEDDYTSFPPDHGHANEFGDEDTGDFTPALVQAEDDYTSFPLAHEYANEFGDEDTGDFTPALVQAEDDSKLSAESLEPQDLLDKPIVVVLGPTSRTVNGRPEWLHTYTAKGKEHQLWAFKREGSKTKFYHCKIEGCMTLIRSKDVPFCKTHMPDEDKQFCAAPNCNKAVKSHGLCNYHFERSNGGKKPAPAPQQVANQARQDPPPPRSQKRAPPAPRAQKRAPAIQQVDPSYAGSETTPRPPPPRELPARSLSARSANTTAPTRSTRPREGAENQASASNGSTAGLGNDTQKQQVPPPPRPPAGPKPSSAGKENPK